MKRIYFENLDGLRFICFALIFFHHSFTTNYDYIIDDPVYHFVTREVFNNGNLGVNFFFVLSGFLITFLLIREKLDHGKIHILQFWVRRILRIWPVYFFCVFFGFVLFPYFKSLFGQAGAETANPINYITFLSNFDIINNGLPDASVLGILWSVAIEEQFYLVWPLLLFLFPIRHYWIPFSVVIISSVVFRIYHDEYYLREYHTFSCMGDLALGAFGAWLVATRSSVISFVKSWSKGTIALIWLSLILYLIFRDEYISPIYPIRMVERIIFGLIALFIIYEQNYSENSLFKFTNWKRISYLGRISYGLYSYHFIAILIVVTFTSMIKFNTQLWQVIILETILSFVLAVVIASLSYKYFEKPFLKLKNRFTFVTSGSKQE